MTRHQVLMQGGKYPSDVYGKTDCFINLVPDNAIRWGECAERCGITPPGYPERATYRFRDEVYVYENGWLIPVAAWYA